jgi:hypothetical protein
MRGGINQELKNSRIKKFLTNHDSGNQLIPLVYHPLSMRRSSYLKYIIFIIYEMLIPTRCCVLGNNISKTHNSLLKGKYA